MGLSANRREIAEKRPAKAGLIEDNRSPTEPSGVVAMRLRVASGQKQGE